MKSRISQPCSICGKPYIITFDTKKEAREYSFTHKPPFYCLDHNPNVLHGQELLDACRSLLGLKHFDFKNFQKWGSYSQDVMIIKYFESDCKMTIYVDGTEKTDIGWTRVYSVPETLKRNATWESQSAYKTLRLVTKEDVSVIINICNQKIKDAWGMNISEQKREYQRIIDRMSVMDFLIKE
jgi:hypothetical protein